MSRPRVALQIEKNRAHGRALLRGIADYALEQTDWRLELVDPERIRRAEARKVKNWAESDRLRDELAAQGWLVQDSNDGQSCTKR